MRVTLFAVIIVLIHSQHAQRQADRQYQGSPSINLANVQSIFPRAASISKKALANGGHEVLDADGDVLGLVLQTSPKSDHLIGFSGPTNTLIGFSLDNQIVGLDIVSSGDTREHVEQIRLDERFLNSFVGKSWEQAQILSDIDAVSGATLTSLAIQESILLRFSGGRTSLRFPDPLQINEARRLFEAADSVEQDPAHHALWHVKDGAGTKIGSVLCTSPAADNLIGYQGPTETWIGFQPSGIVSGIVLGRSYDNAQYVNYVRDDKYFLSLFDGLSLQELAELDPVEAEIDGVSGATMTSMTVTLGMIQAAKEFRVSSKAASSAQSLAVNWGLSDLGTAMVVIAGIAIALTRLRVPRYLRLAFQLLLIGYLGLINGDLISQAMIVGWAQNGVPWRNAGGLALLTLAAFLVPITTKRNVYCTHLCPHGAAQQLLKRRVRWQLALPRWLSSFLKMVPALLLAWCVVVAIVSLPMSLVDIEPFNAWVFRVAGWASITIAIIGLVASLFVPMAYCRYGCPTGLTLGFLRLSARSGQWSHRDGFAVALAVLAVILWVVT